MSFTDLPIPMTLVNLNLKGIIPAMNIYAIKNLLLSQNPVSKLYIQRYIKLIEYAIENPTKEKYKEKHHILPKSMFPEYKDGRKFKWNLVKFSARQHFIAHWMLWKAFRSKEMTYAFWMMYNVKTNSQYRYNKINSKQYEMLRKEISSITSNRIRGKNHHFYGKSLTEEHKNKISEINKERLNNKKNHHFYGKSLTEEHKNKISASLIGKSLSVIQKENISINSKDRKKIHKDGIAKNVKLEQLDLWLEDGWTLGCIPKERSYITKEWKNSISEKNCKFIYTIEKDNGVIIESRSLTRFAKEYGYNHGHLYSVLNCKSKFHKDIIKITKRKIEKI